MKLVIRILALVGAIALLLGSAVVVADAMGFWRGQFDPSRVAERKRQGFDEPVSRCSDLERKAILCDDGYPFCGRFDDARGRIELCRERRTSYDLADGRAGGSCADYEKSDGLCDNGFERDLDPLPFTGECHRYGRRGLSAPSVHSVIAMGAWIVPLVLAVTLPWIVFRRARRRSVDSAPHGEQNDH